VNQRVAYRDRCGRYNVGPVLNEMIFIFLCNKMSLNLEVQNDITRYLSVVPSMNRYTRVKVARWLVFLLSLPTREVTRLARTMWEEYPVHPSEVLTLDSVALVEAIDAHLPRMSRSKVQHVVWILQSMVTDWARERPRRDQRRMLHNLLLGYTIRHPRVLHFLWYEHY